MLIPKKRQYLPPSDQAGFTLIESLLAILVVTLLMVGLTPILVFSVGTRVQAKRVEQASQAARSYIDAVRSGAVLHPPVMKKEDTSAYPAPTETNLDCSANAYCKPPMENFYCVDGSDDDTRCTNDSYTDLVIQAFGQIPTTVGGEPLDAQKGYRGYRLGVRVYRAAAFQTGTEFLANTTQSSVKGGTGLDKKQAPLLQMTTQMVVTDRETFKKACKSADIPEEKC